MTALATWAQTLVSIANLVLKDGFTATYLHSGNVCWQYLARRTAPKLVTVW